MVDRPLLVGLVVVKRKAGRKKRQEEGEKKILSATNRSEVGHPRKINVDKIVDARLRRPWT